MTLQALMLHIIVVIYVCRKLHWFRPDLSDLVLGVFSSPVRFVIIELDLSHGLMRDKEISKIYYPFPPFVLLFYYCSTYLFSKEKRRFLALAHLPPLFNMFGVGVPRQTGSRK